MEPADIVRISKGTLEGLLAPHSITSCGVTLSPKDTWETGCDHIVERDGLPSLFISHDEREAPYATTPASHANPLPLPTHVTITDEDRLVLIAWAEPAQDSPVRGIGIDLASTEDFAGQRGKRFNHLLFTPQERLIATTISPEDDALACAYAFSAKEAAFKACAAPLRRWYLDHSEELCFEVRDFELADEFSEKGTARKGAAARALRALGISRIVLARQRIENMALTFAAALG